MVKRNPHVAKLHAGYLFPEIIRRKHEFIKKNPQARLISLGIGDTTQPLPEQIANSLAQTAQELGTLAGYRGYGPEEGEADLRHLLSTKFYGSKIEQDEIFISDGTNCDIGRLQVLFGSQVRVAVQDPSYPVYVDTGVVLGQSSHYNAKAKGYQGFVYMPCAPENDFFPSLANTPPVDLIYFCSPNNPTGAAATTEQLTQLVEFAKSHNAIIIYDSAYAAYIRDQNIPKSIYQIPGAREVAIELGSFSKMAGFTGIRLGWSVVPKELCFEDKSSVHRDWMRVHTTFFNGASNIAQAGGMAVLQPKNQPYIQGIIDIYMEHVSMLHSTFKEFGYQVYGGINAPYLWVKFPNMSSWDAFDMLLEKAHIICAPGSGFGPAGEGFLRFSAFALRPQIKEAIERLHCCLKSRNHS